VAQIVKEINRRGVTVLLVEQNIPLAFGVAKRGYALQVGKVVLEGTTDELQSAGVVKQTYLGA
jgi:branched-chain amino acid transport system ATP-binding protein